MIFLIGCIACYTALTLNALKFFCIGGPILNYTTFREFVHTILEATYLYPSVKTDKSRYDYAADILLIFYGCF